MTSFLRLATLALLSLLFVAANTGAAETGFVRVNQLGYEAGAHGRAYLLAATPHSGGVFHLRDASGAYVFTAPVGAALGTWGNFTVYALDFNVSACGTYVILVEGPFSGTSPSFRIARPAELYSQALANALSFYQNERDGENFIPSPLRTAAGHLNDRQAAAYTSPQFDQDDNILGALNPTGKTVDASGGWWDAGDYLKFVQTHSYVVALMLIGVRDFPKEMGRGAGSDANFTAEAKFGLRWLEKMWDDNTQTLYYQVGIGSDFVDDPDALSDHDLWRLPQDDDGMGGSDPAYRYIRNRPVFVAGAAGSKISPNLAGRLAADFAACSQVYRDSDRTFADKCLLYAEHIFALADPAPSGNLVTTAPFDFYGESEYRDDMELGATELYFAVAGASGSLPANLPHSDPKFYLRAAAHWAHLYITGPCDACDTLNLYDVSGLAHFELIRAISDAGKPKNLEVTQQALLADIKKELDNAAATAASDPFGFGFPWASYDTTTHGTGLAVVAHEYALLTHSASYRDIARGWQANVLGANAWGSSFLVGDGTVFPDCLQHQVANIRGSLDGSAPILAGAVVEGPNTFAATGTLDGMRKCPPAGGDAFKKFNGNGAIYKDRVQSYSTVEPAIDLSISSTLMFAWASAGAPAVYPLSETFAAPATVPSGVATASATPAATSAATGKPAAIASRVKRTTRRTP